MSHMWQSWVEIELLCILITLPCLKHSSTELPLRVWGSYALCKHGKYSWVYPACMSPALNGSSTLEHFKCNRNPGLSTHHLFICLSLLPSFLFCPSLLRCNQQHYRVYFCCKLSTLHSWISKHLPSNRRSRKLLWEPFRLLGVPHQFDVTVVHGSSNVRHCYHKQLHYTVCGRAVQLVGKNWCLIGCQDIGRIWV